jgi:hypothetical protein
MDPNDGEVILADILMREIDSADEARGPHGVSGAPIEATPDEPKKKGDDGNHSQWALGGNDRFIPVGSTAPRLTAGVYEPFTTPGAWGLEKVGVASDGLYTLPDMATDAVLKEVQTFWSSESKYRKHNLLYKRGIILWGPPGGGKTACIKLLMNELVKQDGIVILASNVNLVIMVLKALRRIEPTRNIIVVFEDIDEIINYNGESGVLSMLDGENNVDNILHLASTNYPERLGARIINRPSRFDRRVYVGMPSREARAAYLSQATGGELTGAQLDTWVGDTDQLSIAHLRELIAAVHCLDQPYAEVLERLKAMTSPIKSEDGFKAKNLGFRGAKAAPFYLGHDSDQASSGG